MYCLTIKPIDFFKRGKTRNYIFSSVQRGYKPSLNLPALIPCLRKPWPIPLTPPAACPGRPRTNWPHPLLRYSLLPPSSQQQKSQNCPPSIGFSYPCSVVREPKQKDPAWFWHPRRKFRSSDKKAQTWIKYRGHQTQGIRDGSASPYQGH